MFVFSVWKLHCGASNYGFTQGTKDRQRRELILNSNDVDSVIFRHAEFILSIIF